MTRRTSTDVHERIEHIVDDIEFVSGDLLDQSSITSIIVADVEPHEIYNLAAQSFVPDVVAQPVLTGEFTALGVTRVLEAFAPSIRASASTRPRVPRCSARSKRCRRTSTRRSIRARPTA
jgi:GDP-D-mannose dehydratase